MIKFYEWFTNNRQTIGIIVGILAILAGLGSLLIGALIGAVINLASGALILHDVWIMGTHNEEH